MSQTLQQRNTRQLFGRMLLILLAASLLFYVLMRMQANHMQQKLLELRQINVETALHQPSMQLRSLPGEYILDSSFAASLLNQQRDTVMFHPGRKQDLPFAMLTRKIFLRGRTWYLTTFVSSEEISHLIIKVFAGEALILLLLFAAMIWINRRSAGILWAPFRQTLARLHAYDITRHTRLGLPSRTGTQEFDELNAAVAALITKINEAYHNQKQFVENASHELQTPLTIIRSKLELLSSQPNLGEVQARLLNDISNANERMSRMNRNLLLLAKIENNQFPDKVPVQVDKLLRQLLRVYEETYEEDMPAVKASYEPLTISANASLMEVLLGNLVRNAVLHNVPDGGIELLLTREQLVIRNSGTPPLISPELLFERFRKGTDAARSTGLGLALVKQICDLYQFGIGLAYEEGLYTCTLVFGRSSA